MRHPTCIRALFEWMSRCISALVGVCLGIVLVFSPNGLDQPFPFLQVLLGVFFGVTLALVALRCPSLSFNIVFTMLICFIIGMELASYSSRERPTNVQPGPK